MKISYGKTVNVGLTIKQMSYKIVLILNFFIKRYLILRTFLKEMVIVVTLLTFVSKDFLITLLTSKLVKFIQNKLRAII